MPICTYLNQDEGLTVDHKDLNELLQDIRKATGDDWRITESRFYRHSLFLKPKTVILYSLYIETSAPEYQIINFYRDDEETSINTTVPAELIMAYLYGQLSGHYKGNKSS